jgi:NADH:ubiquinone oxidoreductase subunit F (NADH-binding)
MTGSREHWLLPSAPFRTYAEYRGATGASALDKARALDPDAILRVIQDSGLRGRGGAGFPTGTKWASVKNHPCETRFVVCNAAEGEPGTFKDRWLLRHNPYATLEGMLIAARVVGAWKLHIAIKASFAPELERLRGAIDELRAAGLLADHTIEITEGPDEYLFGEEKALLEVIEGNEPLPREPHYPPYERGLWATPGCPNPAVVNNAETFAHVPSIIRAGAESFRALGTADTPGTILYTVSGAVARPGVYEREAGVPLRELFEAAAGGPPPGRRWKAALSGVSNGVIPADKFDTPADFGSLALIGSGLGSAGFMLFDDTTSMARVAQGVARFLYVESCNQCSACKAGLRTASEALDELFDPRTATPDDIPRALYGARSAPQGNRCYLPVEGATLIPSLWAAFADDFQRQLQRPAEAPAPVLITKLVDHDPRGQIFTIDERQAHKKPDWTYAAPPTPAVKPARPAAAPRDLHQAPVAVRLAPDVLEALVARGSTAGRSLDREVNEALRAWLARR